MNAAGTAAIGNGEDGIRMWAPSQPGPSNNTIGGTGAGEGNTIANSGGNGILLLGRWYRKQNPEEFHTLQHRVGDRSEPGGATVNDADDVDTGPNDLVNFPILSTVEVSGGNLVVAGYARPGSIIELFVAAADPSGFGEGQTWKISLTEGGTGVGGDDPYADTDAGTGTYGPGAINGLLQGTDTTNKFRFTFPVPAGVAAGTTLSATATIAGSTSEFSGNVTVTTSFSISGRVFEDANFAGTASGWDGGASDLGLANVDVELYNAGTNAYIASATTAAGGTFTFGDVANGNYKVRVRSATIGDADTPPKGGLNATVPATWPYPLAELTWGNGAALYGGQSAIVDDTATGDNAGPGDTFVTVTMSGADVTGVDFGFAYNLILNASDDPKCRQRPQQQGSVRQFLKNANATGTREGQPPARASSGSRWRRTNEWWRRVGDLPAAGLPAIADPGTTLDARRRAQQRREQQLWADIVLFGGGTRLSRLALASSRGGAGDSRRLQRHATGGRPGDGRLRDGHEGGESAVRSAPDGGLSQLPRRADRRGCGKQPGRRSDGGGRNVICGKHAQRRSARGSRTASNQVQGNYIGLDAAGSSVVGNGVRGSISTPRSELTRSAAPRPLPETSSPATGWVSTWTGRTTSRSGKLVGLDAGGTLDRGNTGPGSSRARSTSRSEGPLPGRAT